MEMFLWKGLKDRSSPALSLYRTEVGWGGGRGTARGHTVFLGNRNKTQDSQLHVQNPSSRLSPQYLQSPTMRLVQMGFHNHQNQDYNLN